MWIHHLMPATHRYIVTLAALETISVIGGRVTPVPAGLIALGLLIGWPLLGTLITSTTIYREAGAIRMASSGRSGLPGSGI